MPRRPMNREQIWILPPSLDDLLGAGHPARFVGEFVDGLKGEDWEEIGVDRYGDPMGAPSYHPRGLLGVWLYGFMSGVRSSRKLEAACRDQIQYLWLTGCQRPDHVTLWRFYRTHRDGMRKLLKRTVRTAVKMELVELAVQAVDGTKVRANAAKDRTYDVEGLGRLLGRLERAIDELEAQNESGDDSSVSHLPETLHDRKVLREQVRESMRRLASEDSQKQVNLTDRDARMMKTRQGFAVAYNAQAMVSPVAWEGEEAGMLVTAVDVVDEPSDRSQLGKMMGKAEETLGQRAETTLADAGYHSGSSLEECAPKKPIGGDARVPGPGSGESLSQGPLRLRRGRGQLPLPRGTTTALHPHQAHSQHNDAALPGIRGHVPGLSGLRGLHHGQASWARPGDRLPRRFVASSPGLDAHRRSQTSI